MYLTTRKTTDGVELKLARGGHPAQLLRRVDGAVEVVDSPGSLLGCLPNPGLADIRLLLSPGEMPLLYTDGVTEARHAGQQFNDTRLQALLATNVIDAHTVVDHIIDAALAQTPDDMISTSHKKDPGLDSTVHLRGASARLRRGVVLLVE